MASDLFSHLPTASQWPLVVWTKVGLYCPAGDFYIDPHRSVDTAVITHAHSDHARRGSKKYICTSSSVGLLKSRLGQKICVESFPYGVPFLLENRTLGSNESVRVSFHSAGHILGSAQIRIEHPGTGEVWVASGDYKREPDPSCDPFEVVKCDTFITEATFGTPRFVWDRKRLHGHSHGNDIYDWWKQNAAQGKNSLLFGYSLGKAQRILAELAPFADKPILIHPSITELTQCYRDEGRLLAPTEELPGSCETQKLTGELLLAPPSILKTEWLEHLGRYETAFASGWMMGSYSYRDVDMGFVMSDHADWNDLNQTIMETKAKQIYVLHRNGALVRHLRKQGLEAHSISALSTEHLRRPVQLNLFPEQNRL